MSRRTARSGSADYFLAYRGDPCKLNPNLSRNRPDFGRSISDLGRAWTILLGWRPSLCNFSIQYSTYLGSPQEFVKVATVRRSSPADPLRKGRYAPKRVRLTSSLEPRAAWAVNQTRTDRKSTRLNSSHLGISYAV